MTTNIYLGFPFGFISVTLHTILMFADPRPSYRFYNISLFCWVTANFLWMTLEFTTTQPSSHVHIGPKVPIGGLSDDEISDIFYAKTTLFFFAALVQVAMYLGIYYKILDMPKDYNEDYVSKNEAQLLFRGGAYKRPARTDLMILKGEAAVEEHSYDITLAFIENAYIIFWISKDLFWSWGTGDLTRGRDQVIFYESTAMLFGTLSILIYCITAYIYRRNLVLLLDSLTTICWIGANYVWMCGEFFLRYNNLQYDDTNEHDDWQTRVASAILFCSGLLIQLFVISYLSYQKYGGDLSACSRRPKRPSHQIEMFSFGPIIPSLVPVDESGKRRIRPAKNPIQKLSTQESYADDDEEEILF
jgi:hypothetical protein